MFKYLLIIATSFLTSCAVSDVSVYVVGHVTDDKGDPLSDVTVEFISPVQTDSNGCFAFYGLYSSKPIKLRISKEGYKSFNKTIEFDFYRITAVLTETASNKENKVTLAKLDNSFSFKRASCGNT